MIVRRLIRGGGGGELNLRRRCRVALIEISDSSHERLKTTMVNIAREEEKR